MQSTTHPLKVTQSETVSQLKTMGSNKMHEMERKFHKNIVHKKND